MRIVILKIPSCGILYAKDRNHSILKTTSGGSSLKIHGVGRPLRVVCSCLQVRYCAAGSVGIYWRGQLKVWKTNSQEPNQNVQIWY